MDAAGEDARRCTRDACAPHSFEAPGETGGPRGTSVLIPFPELFTEEGSEPDFIFVILVGEFVDLFEVGMMFHGVANRVEFPLADLFGVTVAVENEALLFDLQRFETIEDAGKGVEILRGRRSLRNFETGVGEFDAGVGNEFGFVTRYGVRRAGFGELFGMAALAFLRVETNESGLWNWMPKPSGGGWAARLMASR